MKPELGSEAQTKTIFPLFHFSPNTSTHSHHISTNMYFMHSDNSSLISIITHQSKRSRLGRCEQFRFFFLVGLISTNFPKSRLSLKEAFLCNAASSAWKLLHLDVKSLSVNSTHCYRRSGAFCQSGTPFGLLWVSVFVCYWDETVWMVGCEKQLIPLPLHFCLFLIVWLLVFFVFCSLSQTQSYWCWPGKLNQRRLI